MNQWRSISLLIIFYKVLTINMSLNEELLKRTRINFLEIKMEGIHEHLADLPREVSFKGRSLTKMMRSSVNEKTTKSKGNPEEGVNAKAPKMRASLGRELSQMTNVVFTLPEIKSNSLVTETDEGQQRSWNRIEGYNSSRSQLNSQKISKNISSRYYKQIEVLKQIREPALSRKVFTIVNMGTKGLEELGRHSSVVPIQKANGKKVILPISAIDKYQIFKEKEAPSNPQQLSAKRFEQKGDSEILVREQKRVKEKKIFDLLQKKRRLSNVEERGEYFKLQGWASDHAFAHFDD